MSRLRAVLRDLLRPVLRPVLGPPYRKMIRSSWYRNAREAWVLRRFRDRDRLTIDTAGASLLFSTEDRFSKTWFFPRLADGSPHEPAVTHHLARELRSSHCFVDAGALVGYFTCLAGKLMPEGDIHAFEMDAANHRLLEVNVRLNQLDHVTANAAAVADRAGTMRYSIASSKGGGVFKLASLRTELDPAILHEVPTVSLDDYFADRQDPDLLKIDVEGAEILVLRGMERLLAEAKPRVFVEVHPNTIQGFDAQGDDVLDLLEGFGYRIQQVPSAVSPGFPLEPVERPIVHNVMLFATHPDGP